MPMNRVVSKLRLSPLRLLSTCLLAAAAWGAPAQVPEAASAPELSASAAPGPVPAAASATTAAPVIPAVLPAPARLPAQLPAQLPAVSALAEAPTWKALTPAQRLLLAPLERDWDRLGPNQRNKWLSAAPMLASLPPPELDRLHERMRDWSKLTPDERRDARIAFQFAKQLDAEKRREKWEAYQALPPEKRQELAEKAAARKRALANAPMTSVKTLAAQPKSNLVPAAPRLRTQVAVNGSVIQARPGASTVLITQAPALPSHHVAGEAKVVADPSLVDPRTLLPKSLKAAQRAPQPPSTVQQ